MNVTRQEENGTLTLLVEGRLDTTTAPQLEEQIPTGTQIQTLILDLSKLEYVSSAGLRVLLCAQKQMSAQGGKLIVKNAQDAVLEVFEITGFNDILTLEHD